MTIRTLSAIAAALLAASCGAARAQSQQEIACGSLANAYGPYDYRVYKDTIEIKRVEQYHFTPLVENLIKPMFQHFSGDFDYTLRASPNHHRALMTMVRWTERVKDPKPPGASYTTDCYFDRAMRFAPDDLVVRMIYAAHLGRVGRKPEAMQQLDYVAAKAEDNAFTHYNAGLCYFELGEFAKAQEQAVAAAGLGLPHAKLREMLQAAGKWTESKATEGRDRLDSAQPAAVPASAVPAS